MIAVAGRASEERIAHGDMAVSNRAGAAAEVAPGANVRPPPTTCRLLLACRRSGAWDPNPQVPKELLPTHYVDFG